MRAVNEPEPELPPMETLTQLADRMFDPMAPPDPIPIGDPGARYPDDGRLDESIAEVTARMFPEGD